MESSSFIAWQQFFPLVKLSNIRRSKRRGLISVRPEATRKRVLYIFKSMCSNEEFKASFCIPSLYVCVFFFSLFLIFFRSHA